MKSIMDTHKAKEIAEGWTQEEVYDWFTERGEHLRKGYLEYTIHDHCGDEYILIHLDNFPEADDGRDVYLLYNLSDEVKRSVDALIDSYPADNLPDFIFQDKSGNWKTEDHYT